LTARDVDAERHVILEELAAAREDPDDVASVALYEALFPDHPLGRETLGTPETIRDLGRDDVAGFFADWYRPANLVVAAAGAVDHDELTEEVLSRFGGMPSGEAPVREPPASDPRPHVFTERLGELVHVGVGWRAPAITDPDRYALSVLNHAFGGGPSSVLFQEIREARGLTYSIGSDLSQHGDAGALSVHCATHTEQGDQLVGLICHLAAEMAASGIDSETLKRVKGAVRGGVVMAMESVTARMTRLGGGETALGAVTPLGVYLERIEAVTCDDVQRVASEVFVSPCSVSVVGPRDIT
jgi:predicted Zn-dependent peptidase